MQKKFSKVFFLVLLHIWKSLKGVITLGRGTAKKRSHKWKRKVGGQDNRKGSFGGPPATFPLIFRDTSRSRQKLSFFREVKEWDKKVFIGLFSHFF